MFVKGQSGNPKGRPKGTSGTALRQLLVTRYGKGGSKLITRLETLSQSDNPIVALKATGLLLAYLVGLPTQSLEHSGPDGGAIVTKISFGGRYRPEGA